MEKLFYLDPNDIPCPLDRLQTSFPLNQDQYEQLLALECGASLEVVPPGQKYGETIVCCGDARHVAVWEALQDRGAFSHMSDAGAWIAVRYAVAALEKATEETA